MDHPVFRSLDHVAIVVPDTEAALEIWRDRVGLKLLYSEVVNNGAIRLTHLDLGNTQLQLVEPLQPDHPLKAWVAKNGPGLHHLCFRVDDVGQAFVELPKMGPRDVHLRILAVSAEHNIDHAALADTVNIAELRGGKIYPGNSAVGEVTKVGAEVTPANE